MEVPTACASAEMAAFRPLGAFRSVMIVEVAELAILVTASLAANIGVPGGNSLGVGPCQEPGPIPDLSQVWSRAGPDRGLRHFVALRYRL
jgi:hypothetical protein